MYTKVNTSLHQPMKFFALLRSRVLWFMTFLLLSVPMAHAAFSDVGQSHPNRAAIEYLQGQGILQGYSDGTFRPDATVNRVEALKIILMGNGIEIQKGNGQVFRDAPAGSWYGDYIHTAKNLGIIQGYPDGSFKPEQTVALVENLKMALLSADIDTSVVEVEANMYADIQNQQSAWFAKYLQYAKNNKLIDADANNRISAAQGMTRGKLAELMYRMMVPDRIIDPNPSTEGLAITVDPSRDRKEISPYIYGSNIQEAGGNLFRLGGNRWTAYNWMNNASNAGADWGPHHSDGFLSESETPGEAVRERVAEIIAKGADALVTIPIVDFVAADKNGIVQNVASDSNSRWVRNLATASPAFPNAVTQDAFLKWLKGAFAEDLAMGTNIFISLDNEPALWSSTHALVHPQPVTYAEMVTRTTTFATMIKQVMPQALVFGAVSYGYNEYETLQNAPDAAGRNFLAHFLSSMKAAEDKAGKRLVDVLDLHWYPEARGNGNRITNNNSESQSAGEVEARLQAPRSLWDPNYIEDSWIAKDYLGNKPIQLLTTLQNTINTNYPDTKLSFTEYNHGGADHISGGLAQADVLGAFGKYGVFAAAHWPLSEITEKSYVQGAFDLFLNYDGKGSDVGDTSIYASNPDVNALSVYGFTGDSRTIYLLVINKTTQSQTITAQFQNASPTEAEVYQLSASNRTPKALGTTPVSGEKLSYTVEGMSAVLFVAG